MPVRDSLLLCNAALSLSRGPVLGSPSSSWPGLGVISTPHPFGTSAFHTKVGETICWGSCSLCTLYNYMGINFKMSLILFVPSVSLGVRGTIFKPITTHPGIALPVSSPVNITG